MYLDASILVANRAARARWSNTVWGMQTDFACLSQASITGVDEKPADHHGRRRRKEAKRCNRDQEDRKRSARCAGPDCPSSRVVTRNMSARPVPASCLFVQFLRRVCLSSFGAVSAHPLFAAIPTQRVCSPCLSPFWPMAFGRMVCLAGVYAFLDRHSQIHQKRSPNVAIRARLIDSSGNRSSSPRGVAGQYCPPSNGVAVDW
jgi:hypothetical protein